MFISKETYSYTEHANTTGIMFYILPRIKYDTSSKSPVADVWSTCNNASHENNTRSVSTPVPERLGTAGRTHRRSF